jgi:flagellar hook-associated protein 3 FlgL
MRIPTFNSFQRQAQVISQQFDNMRKLQQQASSGKKLINYSDDPVLASQIQSSQDYLDQLHGYDRNGILAQKRTGLYSSVMKSAVDAMNDIKTQLQRVQGTSTLNETDRKNLAEQIEGDRNILLNIANTRDANGDYIFAGFNTQVTPFINTSNGYVYQGGLDASFIDISLNAQSMYNESGYAIFGNIPLGNGYYTAQASASNVGTASTSAGTVNVNSYVADTYTISLVNNSSNELSVRVVGANSGQVIPASGEPPLYIGNGKNGMDLTFNGVTINISGDAKLGDSFTVAPTKTQDIFTTIQDVINVMKNPITNQGVFDQTMRQANASFTQIQNKFSTYQVDVGSRSISIDSEIKSNAALINYQTAALGDLENADMTVVFTNLAQQSLALQATQEGYLKIQETFSQLLRI